MGQEHGRLQKYERVQGPACLGGDVRRGGDMSLGEDSSTGSCNEHDYVTAKRGVGLEGFMILGCCKSLCVGGDRSMGWCKNIQ